jgi:hypothetical protein
MSQLEKEEKEKTPKSDHKFSDGSSGWRSGDRHPLRIPVFHFPPQKRKNTGYTASNRLRKPFFLHGRHPLTDFLDPPLSTGSV